MGGFFIFLWKKGFEEEIVGIRELDTSNDWGKHLSWCYSLPCIVLEKVEYNKPIW